MKGFYSSLVISPFPGFSLSRRNISQYRIEITMPGRKPLPTAIKRMKGTLQPCRANRHEPRPRTTLGTSPEYMSESAKEAWQYAITNAPPGLLSALDGAVLERWANCSGMYREALTKINGAGVFGMLIKTPSGILRRSPLMDVIRDLALEMKGYETEMGLRRQQDREYACRRRPQAIAIRGKTLQGDAERR